MQSLGCKSLGLVLLMLAVAGCRSSSTTTTILDISLSDSFPSCGQGRVLAPRPIAGLFVGVSEYEEASDEKQTPAHTLAAASMLEVFYSARHPGFVSNPEDRLFYNDWQGRLRSVARPPGASTLFQSDDQAGALRGTRRLPGRDLVIRGEPLEPVAEDLVLLADLKLPLIEEQERLLVTKDQQRRFAIMRRLTETDGVLHDLRGYDDFILGEYLPDDRRWPYVGEGKPVTKARLLDAIQHSLDQLGRRLDAGEPVTFVFYLAAHGMLGDDGTSYILPGDAVKGRPETWVSFDELLGVFYAFQSGRQPDKRHPMLLILDTCRRNASKVDVPPLALPTPPAGVTVVTSTSPNQYAWHWFAKSSREEVVRETSGSVTLMESRVAHTEIDLGVDISAFPVAARRALKSIADVAVKERWVLAPMTTLDWLKHTGDVLDQLIAEEKVKGYPQTMQVLTPKPPDTPVPLLMFTGLEGAEQSKLQPKPVDKP